MIAAATARPEFRIMVTVPIALVTTFLLLFLMQRLIYTDFVSDEVISVTPVTDIFYKETPIVTQKKEPPKKVEEPLPVPPALPFEPQMIKPADGTNYLNLGPAVTKGGTGTKIKLSTGGALVKQVMVPPVYPGRQLARGVEGYVDLRFDVTEYGATKNIQVMNSEPVGVFDDAAVKAVQRWRYRPRMEEGVPVPSQNVQERIRFKIEN